MTADSKTSSSDDALQPVFRSAAVARRAGMPVATLRIWEQRHRAVRPATAPSGHRLYSSADVERVLLLRRLTAQGHAIGSIAALDTGRLRRLATSLGDGVVAVRDAAPLRLVVVGRALAARLQRPATVRRLAVPAIVVAAFDSPEAAAAGALAVGVVDGDRVGVVDGVASVDGSDGVHEAAAADPIDPIDLLVWQLPGLPEQVPPALGAARAAWGARHTAVLHRFAGAAARRAFEDAGALVLREPPDDEALGAWLATLDAARSAPRFEDPREDTRAVDEPQPGLEPTADAVPPRRFDDAALTAIAGLRPSMACECPRHVAELLMQLSGFEAYSAQCASRGPADAALHAHLQRVAGTARAMFEAALERVARHEGLPLPHLLEEPSDTP